MSINLIVSCMGYPIFADHLDNLFPIRKMTINTINQYSYCVAENDPQFKKALLESDVLLPDGVGITKAAKFLRGETVKKIAGADLHAFLLEQLNQQKGSCFYLGSSLETLNTIKAKMGFEYPNIKVGIYSPPFKKEFSLEDNSLMVAAVNDFKPDVLFIGMTAPKQEKWSYQHKDQLDTGLICSIGAVFDFYAGTVNRPSVFWQNLGLEWLGRLVKEPKRMWKRYIYYGAIFGVHLVKEKLKPTSVTPYQT